MVDSGDASGVADAASRIAESIEDDILKFLIGIVLLYSMFSTAFVRWTDPNTTQTIIYLVFTGVISGIAVYGVKNYNDREDEEEDGKQKNSEVDKKTEESKDKDRKE